MKAIILASAQSSERYGLDEHLPLPLFALGDRPILHHVVDCLAAQGVRHFDFVLGHLPDKIEAYLGDGARWGCTFRFHLLQSDCEPFHFIEGIAASLDDEVVLGRGDRLPELQLSSQAGPLLYMNSSKAWTGWAVVPRAAGLLAGLENYAAGKSFLHDPVFSEVAVAREISFETAPQLLQGQHDLLTGGFTGSAVSGRQTEPGVWIARNVSLHPSVKLQAPVYIGANCKIEAGVRLGPSAVIGEGCIVDEHSSIANTLVAPGTYIGQDLELDFVIVDRNRLVNTKIGTSVLVSENFLLSGLSRHNNSRVFQRIISRTSALALLLLVFPLACLTLLFLAMSGKGEFVRERAVCIPAGADPHTWREYNYLRFRLFALTMAGWWTYFAAEVWPGLLSVLKGELFLVGVKPRSRQEVERLPSDWRSIYLSSKGGLITEAFVMFGRSPNEDELYTAEAYYTAVESTLHDLKLLRLYLGRLLISSGRAPVDFIEDGSLRSPLENLSER